MKITAKDGMQAMQEVRAQLFEELHVLDAICHVDQPNARQRPVFSRICQRP